MAKKKNTIVKSKQVQDQLKKSKKRKPPKSKKEKGQKNNAMEDEDGWPFIDFDDI